MRKLALTPAAAAGLPARRAGKMSLRLLAAAAALGAVMALVVPHAARAESEFNEPGPAVTAVSSGGVYQISANNFGMVAHVCGTTDVTYKGVSGVFCSDIYALAQPSSGNVQVYAMAEGYCQGGSGIVECPQINAEYQGKEDAAQPDTLLGYPDCSVHSITACNTSTRNFFDYSNYAYTRVNLSNDGDCHSFSNIVYYDSDIYLPGDILSQLTSGNLTTPTVKICNNM